MKLIFKISVDDLDGKKVCKRKAYEQLNAAFSSEEFQSAISRAMGIAEECLEEIRETAREEDGENEFYDMENEFSIEEKMAAYRAVSKAADISHVETIKAAKALRFRGNPREESHRNYVEAIKYYEDLTNACEILARECNAHGYNQNKEF